MRKKLISFDIKAEFGFLKKPDINEGIYLTYTSLHKPCLLGILGAIIGLGGHYQSYISKRKLPEYYEKLGNIKVGVQPLNSLKGNFTKIAITYNNSIGYANLDGGTLIVTEQTLIEPSYRVYLLLDFSNEYEKKLYDRLLNNESEFIPYLGKNDFQLWWEERPIEYDYEQVVLPQNSYSIETLFIKPEGKTIRENSGKLSDILADWSDGLSYDFFIFFERLPVGFDELTTNYRYGNFIYTNQKLQNEFVPDNLYFLKKENKYVQLN